MSGGRSVADEILAELPLDNTGHICACGIDDTNDCSCSSLRPRLEAIVARHVAAALSAAAEVVRALPEHDSDGYQIRAYEIKADAVEEIRNLAIAHLPQTSPPP